MRPIRVFVLLSLLTCTPCRADQTDDYVQVQMRERRISGAALTVIQNGTVTKTAAYGLADIEQTVPVTTETVFEIGSISKQFTAAGILLLEQQGKLSVNDKIGNYLKDVPDSWKNITVRHLLTHTSGIRNYTGLKGFDLTRHLTQKQFIDELGKQPMDFQPGASWRYCNSGFNLLGFIIENVSGANYWAYMEQNLFHPLRMTATGDRQPGKIIPHRAHGYEQTNHVWINRDYDLTDVFSAGAIASTIGDLARWNAALDGDGLLNATSKQEMWTRAKLNNGKETTYGFGWFVDSVDGHKNIGHGGSTSGFSASIQRFPDDRLAVILLTNTDEQVATTMAKKIATFYFQLSRESAKGAEAPQKALR